MIIAHYITPSCGCSRVWRPLLLLVMLLSVNNAFMHLPLVCTITLRATLLLLLPLL
jgi:hypothetical protein